MKRSHLLGAMCACLASVSLNANATSVSSSVTVTGQNSSSQFDFEPITSVNNTSLVSVNRSYDITGMMNNGTQGTMTYAVNATAQTDPGSLHASYSTSITNAFYNAANEPYDQISGTGVPTHLSGQSNSSFIDSITVTGDPDLAEIKLIVNMEGFLEQSSSSYPYEVGYAALWQKLPSGANSTISGSRISTTPGGSYNQPVTTRPYAVNSGIADVDLLLQVYNNWILEYVDQGENISSTIDFSNTAQVIGIEGYDSLGNIVQITSAIGESGTNYLSAVPIPATVWLFGSGLLGLIGVARRKKSV